MPYNNLILEFARLALVSNGNNDGKNQTMEWRNANSEWGLIMGAELYNSGNNRGASVVYQNGRGEEFITTKTDVQFNAQEKQ